MPLDPSTPDVLWTAVADRIRDDLSPMVFGAWFSTTRALALDGDVLEVGVPNEFTRSWIEGHFSELVRKAASAADPGVSVRFRVADGEPEVAPVGGGALAERTPAASTRVKRGARREQPEPLRSKYTFGSFVIGSSNRFAHAAALAVAESPGQAYNPLVHLRRRRPRQDAPAAGDRALRAAATRRACGSRYISCEEFTNEFIAALKDERMDAVQAALPQRRRPADRRHPLPGQQGRHRRRSSSTRSTRSTTRGKQIVLLDRRAADEIPTSRTASCSRFKWGLVADVQPPDIETRIAILRKQGASAIGLRLPDDAVAAHDRAQRATRTSASSRARSRRVLAYASLTGRPASAALVRETLARPAATPTARVRRDDQAGCLRRLRHSR